MKFPRSVWQLGWVSFFTDLASEMIYPLLPLFLTRVIGAGAMSLGVIEGVAEASNSVLKVASGWLSDRWNARKPLVIAGYTLSSSVRPLMAVVGSWWQVLGLRFTDRLGKGIRGAPRDAILALDAPEGARGRVFGFQRGMDHAGAVVGPLVASLFLFFYPGEYRTLFALTIIPGVVVFILVLTLPSDRGRDKIEVGNVTDEKSTGRNQEQTDVRSMSTLPPAFLTLLAIIFVFSLGNASDAFLLLRLSDRGVAPVWIPLLWSAIHVVKSTSSMYGGYLSDRLGRKQLIIAGWILYAAIYAGFGFFETMPALIALFISYGMYFGLTEGAEKALVADLAPARVSGTAFGLYNGVLGAGALVSSVLFGWIWTAISPTAAFATGAALALAAAALLSLTVHPGPAVADRA